MNKLLIAIFLSFIGGIGLWNVMAEDVRFSKQENRILSPLPTFTASRFFSGDYTKEFEEYISDQFVWKKFWTGMKAHTERVALKQENNGIYFGKSGYLLEEFEKPKEQFQSNLNSIQYFTNKAKDISSYLLLVPTSVDIYKEKLPLYAASYSEKEIIDLAKKQLTGTLSFIDVYNTLLSKKNEPIFFRTDHHWTMRGAFYAYEVAAKTMGITPFKREDFSIEMVSKDFYGTYHSKANLQDIKPDQIEVFQPKFDVRYSVQYEDGERANTLYDWDYLSEKDQYALFLSGNHSLVKIQSTIQNGRKLAVIKDSYAHAFIPFLANHYEEIHVLDLRYYHMNIQEYLRNNEIHETLFLYNVANFSKDTNLIWLQH
jgi:hypothetical protein